MIKQNWVTHFIERMQRHTNDYSKKVSHYFITPALIQTTESDRKYWLWFAQILFY